MTRDAFICNGKRTAIGRYGGIWSQTRPDVMLAELIETVAGQAADFHVDEIVIGCANQAGEAGANMARMAALCCEGFTSVSALTLNRHASSGLDAVAYASRLVALQEADLVLAGGVDSMSRAPYILPKAKQSLARSQCIYDSTECCANPPGRVRERFDLASETQYAQRLADELSISRRDQDGFALRSQARAIAALRSGRMAKEIAQVQIKGQDRKSVLPIRDELPRLTNFEKLGRLNGVVDAGGSVTSGNSAPLADGATAMLVASDTALSQTGLTPLARVAGMCAVGLEPRGVGVAAVPAIQTLLERHSLRVADMDIIELDESYAINTLAVMRALGLPDDVEHVNPNGGAIALGHPIGMTGARLVLSAALNLADIGGKHALVATGVGLGQGVAMLLSAA